MLGSQILAVLIYLVVMLLARSIDSKDVYYDTTIYTQAIEDWEKPFWIDFSWGENGKCQMGSYHDIINYWPGTVEGSYTRNDEELTGVEPSDDKNGQIPAQPPVNQPFYYKQSDVVLCGTRGQYSYRNATRQDESSGCPPENPY